MSDPRIPDSAFDDLFRNRIAAAMRRLDEPESDAEIGAALDAIEPEPIIESAAQRIMQQVRHSITTAAHPQNASTQINHVAWQSEPGRRALPSTRSIPRPTIVVACIAMLLIVGTIFRQRNSNMHEAEITKRELKSLSEQLIGAGTGPKEANQFAVIRKADSGETITTGPREKRRVTLPDGSVLSINENTTVSIVAPRRIKLLTGEVFVEVIPAEMLNSTDSPDANGRFVVETANRQVTALGTKFVVKSEGQVTNVVVTQGKVQVSGVAQVIAAGQELIADLTDSNSTELRPARRSAYVVEWVRDLMAAANSMIIPLSEHSGGTITVVDPQGQEMKLSLRRFHVDVHIEDGFARTTIDQTYFNHTWQQLEGTFRFPLPADASLSRLAMYVNGTLMDGGMVERDYGRNVFEQIRHTRRDPALLEWVDGSTFQMRVFPLEARQEKRIILSYTQRLATDYGKNYYRFPAGHNLEGVRDWSAHVRVKGGAGTKWYSPSHLLEARSDGNDLIVDGREEFAAMDRDLVLELGDDKAMGASNSEPVWSRFEQDGFQYLMVRIRPELKKEMTRTQRHWIFLIENSADRNSILADTQRQIAKVLLENSEHSDTFSIVRAGTQPDLFRDNPVPCSLDHIAAAVEFLREVAPIGALDLGQALQSVSQQTHANHENWIVHLGSGIPVLGERDQTTLLRQLPPKGRYVGVAVGKRWSKSFMEMAASQTGGQVVQINPDDAVAWRAFDLLSNLNSPRLTEIKFSAPSDADGKTDSTAKATQFLGLMNSVSHGQELAAVTRLQIGTTVPKSITITGSMGGEVYSQTVSLPESWNSISRQAANPSTVQQTVSMTSGHLPRTWARLEIDRMVGLGSSEHKAQIIELSKSMYVMSPFTSLLVLETEAMYEQFKVDRGRKDHWAMYAAPAQISVVAEPAVAQMTMLDAAKERLKQAQSRLQTAEKNIDRSVTENRPATDLKRLERLKQAELADVKRLTIEIERIEQAEAATADPVRKAWDSVLIRRTAWQLGNGQWYSNFDPSLQQLNFWGFRSSLTEPTDQERSFDNYYRSTNPVMNTQVLGPVVGNTMPPWGWPVQSLSRNERTIDHAWVSYQSHGQLPSAYYLSDDVQYFQVTEDRLSMFRERGIDGFDSEPAQPVNLRFGRHPFRPSEGFEFYGDVSGVSTNFGTQMLWEPIDVNLAQNGRFKSVRRRSVNLWGEFGGGGFDARKQPALFGGTTFVRNEMDQTPQSVRLLMNGDSNVFMNGSAMDFDSDGLIPLDQLSMQDFSGNGILETPRYNFRFIPAERNGRRHFGGDRPAISRGTRTLGGLQQYYIPVHPLAGILQDLPSYAPGLQTWSADRLAIAEQASTRKPVHGTVDPGARQLIEKARSLGWESIHPVTVNQKPAPLNGPVIADGSGRFKISREVSEGLKETVINDGTTFWHLYPEIGLGAKRNVSRFHQAAIQTLIPWYVPSIDHLSLNADVKLAGERTVRIVKTASDHPVPTETNGQRDEQTKSTSQSNPTPAMEVAVELDFAEEGRLIELRMIDASKNQLLSKQTFAADGTIRLLNAEGKLISEARYERSIAAAPDMTPATAELVVLPLPYRSSDSVGVAVPMNLQNNTADFGKLTDDDAMKLLATYFAESRQSELATFIEQRFAANGDHRIGFAVLLSAVIPQNPTVSNATVRHPDLPLAKFLEQFAGWVVPANTNGTMDAGPNAPPFLKRLCGAYNIYCRWSTERAATRDRSTTDIEQELDQALRCVVECRSLPLTLKLLSTIQDGLKRVDRMNAGFARQLNSTAGSIAVDRNRPGFVYQARIEWLLAIGDVESEAEALRLFRSQLFDAINDGFVPDLRDEVRASFARHFHTPANQTCSQWAELVREAAHQLVTLDQPISLIMMARRCVAVGEPGLATEITKMAIKDQDLKAKLELNLAVLEYAKEAHDWNLAEQCVAHALGDTELRTQSFLWRDAAMIANRQQKFSDWIDNLEKAYELDFADLPKTLNLESFRKDYDSLFSQLEQRTDQLVDANRTEKESFARIVQRAATRWREIDSDDTSACHRAARMLSKLGQATAAWNYWTTPLSAAPDQSSVWTSFANVMQTEHRFNVADKAFVTAYECESTNPDILLQHARFLHSVKQEGRAQAMLITIIQGNWQPRFDAIKTQARAMRSGQW